MTEPTTAGDSSATVVFVMDVADRPGIAHAIAAVFAHRGLSMRALIADAHRRPPRILVVFNGTPRQSRLVAQVLARLHDVHGVRMLPSDSAELHAVALCRGVNDAIPELRDVDIQRLGDIRLLSGRYVDVEAALLTLQDAGMAIDVSRSLVVL